MRGHNFVYPLLIYLFRSFKSDSPIFSLPPPLSPVYSECDSDYFSWVGIIMYLTGDRAVDAEVIRRFSEYHVAVLEAVSEMDGVEVEEHLAKVEADEQVG